MLMREWATHGRLSFRTFYFRRFLRLTPALALTVAVVAVISLALQNPFGAQQTAARTGLGAMLLSANFVIGHAAGDYFATDTTTNPLLNTWSLSVEEQFYLIFPALLAFGWILGRTKGRHARSLSRPPVVVVVSLIAIGSFTLSMLWTYGSPFLSGLTSYFGGPESFAFYSPFSRAWEFAIGALLALRISRLKPRSVGSATALGVGGAVLIGIAAFAIHDTSPFPGALAVVPVVGTALVLLAGAGQTSAVTRGLASRPMVAIGDTSYSWYLWHWPVIVFAALMFPRNPTILVVAAVLSLIPALLSYRLLEQPIRRLRPRSKPRALAVVIPTVAIPLALCTALLVGANGGWGLLPPDSTIPVAAAVELSPLPVVPSAGAGLSAPDKAGRHGDGSAAHAEGLSSQTAAPTNPTAEDQAAIDATAKQDGQVAEGDGGSLRSQHVAVKNGCVNTAFNRRAADSGPQPRPARFWWSGDSQAYAWPTAPSPLQPASATTPSCRATPAAPSSAVSPAAATTTPAGRGRSRSSSTRWRTKPAAVLISNRSGGYVRPELKWRTAATDAGGMATSVKDAASLWRKGMEPVVAQLSKAGIPVIFVSAIPEMHGYTNGTSLLSNAFGTRDFDIPREEAETLRRPAIDVENALAKAYPGVSSFDTFPALCDNASCWAVRDGQVLYQDEEHLSVDGSKLLTGGLTTAIREAVAGSSLSPSATGTP